MLQISQPEHNGALEKNAGICSLPSSGSLVQTNRVPGRARSVQFSPDIPALATFLQTDAPAVVRRPHVCRSRYRNLRFYRTAPRLGSSSQIRRRRGTTPYTAKRESVPAGEFLLRFCRAEDSHFFLAALGAVLRSADKHFDKIIVERIVKLPLKAPFELWMIEVARMQFKIIGMNWDRLIFELNDDFHPFTFGAS